MNLEGMAEVIMSDDVESFRTYNDYINESEDLILSELIGVSYRIKAYKILSELMNNPNSDPNIEVISRHNVRIPLIFTIPVHKSKHLPLILKICKHPKFNVNIKARMGLSILSHFIMYNSEALSEPITYLINHKDIDINAKDSGKRTALHHATTNYSIKYTKLLLTNKNTDLNVLDVLDIPPVCYSLTLIIKRRDWVLSNEESILNLFVNDKRFNASYVLPCIAKNMAFAPAPYPEYISKLFSHSSVNYNTIIDLNTETSRMLLIHILAIYLPDRLFERILKTNVKIDLNIKSYEMSIFLSHVIKHEKLIGPLINYSKRFKKTSKHRINHEALNNTIIGQSYKIKKLIDSYNSYIRENDKMTRCGKCHKLIKIGKYFKIDI